jgi:hypothetical protein
VNKAGASCRQSGWFWGSLNEAWPDIAASSGCNANQEVNPSPQTASGVFAGHYEDTNPYNPISYAQNNTGRGGGGH